jgi:hypothetical protein
MIDDLKMLDIEMLNIDLQLFASDDDDDDFDFDDFDGEDLDDNEDDDADDIDDDADEDSDEDHVTDNNVGNKQEKSDKTDADADANKDKKSKQKKDKITHALIKQKQMNKELKSKLDAIERQSKEIELVSKKKALVDKLVEKGYDDDEAEIEAEKQIEQDTMKHTVKKLEFLTENADIIAKYPDAKKNIDKLMKLQKSTGWSIEKICRVEYSVAENAFDKKVKNDQETRLKQKKKPSTTPVGGQTKIKSLDFDPADERAYQFYAQRNPGVSRKQYQERINQPQKIPHDKWD